MVVLRAASLHGKEEKQGWTEKQKVNTVSKASADPTRSSEAKTEELEVTSLRPSGLYSIFILSHDFPAILFVSMCSSNSLNRLLRVWGVLFVWLVGFALVCSSCKVTILYIWNL